MPSRLLPIEPENIFMATHSESAEQSDKKPRSVQKFHF